MKSQFPNHSADSADISESYLQKFEDCHVFILTMIIFSQSHPHHSMQK